MSKKDKLEKKRPNRVYFIHSEEQRGVKIGHSNKPNKRLDQFQVGNPSELVMLGSIPGGRRLEKRWHAQWNDLWIRGEWFRAEPELMQAILKALASANCLRTVGEELVRRNQCRHGLNGVSVSIPDHPGEIYAIVENWWGPGDDEPLHLSLLPVAMFHQRQAERKARRRPATPEGLIVACIADLIREMDNDPFNQYRVEASSNDCVLMSRWPILCPCWFREGA